jgi:hypothetical protein
MLDGMSLLRVRRSWPVATAAVLAVTVVLTVLQFPFPQVRLALWRDPDALAAACRARRPSREEAATIPSTAATAPSGSPTSRSTWATSCSASACGRPER